MQSRPFSTTQKTEVRYCCYSLSYQGLPVKQYIHTGPTPVHCPVYMMNSYRRKHRNRSVARNALRKRTRLAVAGFSASTDTSLPDQMSTSTSDESMSSLCEGIDKPRERALSSISGILDCMITEIRRVNVRRNGTFSSTFASTPLMVKVACASIIMTFLYHFPMNILRAFFFALLWKICTVLAHWADYVHDDPERRRAFGAVRVILRRVINESEKAMEGDYARLVMAGYLLWNCTAPGESYLFYIIRYKMSILNREVINEIQEWRERKLGYERSQTKRNLFS